MNPPSFEPRNPDFDARVRESFAEAIGGIGTLSAGIAHRMEGETLAQHLHRADAALYQAKRNGGNQFIVHPRGAATRQGLSGSA